MKMGYMLPDSVVIGGNMKTGGNPEFNYDYLKSPEKKLYESENLERNAIQPDRKYEPLCLEHQRSSPF